MLKQAWNSCCAAPVGQSLTAALEPGQHDDSQQVSQVKAICSGVEAAVHGHALAGQEVFQLLAGHLLDESTLSQCLHSVGKLVGACDGGVVSNGACDGGVIYHEYASMQP